LQLGPNSEPGAKLELRLHRARKKEAPQLLYPRFVPYCTGPNAVGR
jgi:hypothetical protein